MVAGALAAALAACQPAPAPAATPPGRSEAGMEQAWVTIQSRGHAHRFLVELARSNEEQAQGLMFREQLGPDRGMWFPMQPPRFVSFWMLNTLIPLDLLFVREDGTIARIAANATPLSRASIPSGEPVAGVLEIAGGRAAQLGIAAGDRLAELP